MYLFGVVVLEQLWRVMLLMLVLQWLLQNP
jgi:hypothetical protein